MMTIRRVRDGEALRIGAEEWNAMAAAGEAHARNRLGDLGGGAGGHDVAPSLTVIVKNETGGECKSFRTLVADRSQRQLLTIPENERSVARVPMIRAKPNTIDSPQPYVMIAQAPIADGESDRAVVRGIAIAWVNVVSLAHSFASPPVSSAAGGLILSSQSASGPVRILQRSTTGTGIQLCLVDVLQVADSTDEYPYGFSYGFSNDGDGNGSVVKHRALLDVSCGPDGNIVGDLVEYTTVGLLRRGRLSLSISMRVVEEDKVLVPVACEEVLSNITLGSVSVSCVDGVITVTQPTLTKTFKSIRVVGCGVCP